jgi:hypothetical protein
MPRTARSKGRIYRGFIIRLMADDRYDVFEQEEDVVDGRPINENFSEISSAMAWIDESQF